ncbi:MAG: hypothetical protein OEY59_08765 [Deltaproteobacteria bacterium]|nr:hypothetical protein [Deltaproteobacteria bacterium]
MIKNAEYVIASYGIFGGAVIVYIIGIYYKLKQVREKTQQIEEK